MRNRKNLTLHVHRIILLLKNTKALFFVPVVITDVFIPILNFVSYRANGIGDELYNNIIQFSQIFIPFLSVWWVVFILRDFIDSDGNEMLYVNKKRSLLLDFIAVFFIYIINVIILYVFYISFFPNMKYELIKLLLVCIFYFGLMFFTSKLTNSVTITLFILTFYLMANLMIYGLEGVFPLYYTVRAANRQMLLCNSLPLGFTGVILFIIGVKIRKKL
ncbi:MAG: hypothetical protein BWY46_01351 [Firmicutes bacterium ADurb.Bin300]|nr:MAG: hypothetical protein BWY46_01351 [Firmicutes bacterium ADurb.Bin300]